MATRTIKQLKIIQHWNWVTTSTETGVRGQK